ncbi:MAG: peptide-methionine (S)-S-oxide reductase MsrA, partial [Cyanobacteriota bacterium]|nr:peptide-methionine (S)-S-oxide reductase MsrA [Cyanobacteriota bacterium]
EIVSYEELLKIFWNIHDPTSYNRQGADRGEQYRSVIFYHTPTQEQLARRSKHQLQITQRYEKEICTQIVAAGEYYLAEDYHQQYYEKQGVRKSR